MTVGLLDPALRLKTQRTVTVTVQIVPGPVERTVANRPVHLRNLGANLSAQAMPAVVDVGLRGSREALSAARGRRRDRVRRSRGPRARASTRSPVHADASERRRRGAHRAGDGAGANHQCQKLNGMPATASVRHRRRPRHGRRSIRSIRRPSAGSAPRSSARCRTATARSPRGCSIGRDTRESGAWIEAELAHGAVGRRRGRHERRRRADAGRRLPHAARGLRRRRRDLRVAQSVRGQRHQGVLRPRREVHRARRARSRSDRRRPVVERRRRAARRAVAAGAGRRRVSRSPARGVAGSAVVSAVSSSPIDCANGATTTVAPGAVREPRLRDRRHRRIEPDGRNINLRLRLDASRAARADRRRARLPHGRRVRRRRRPRDLRRSSRRGRQRRRRAADVRAPAAARRPAEGQRDRRDRHEQHRPRARAAASRASSWCAARSATST